MFKIGDFSKFCRVPTSALRYYANLGLLEPLYTDQATGYRYYSLSQIPRLNRILALKDLGLSLEQIGRLLNEKVSTGELRGMLRLKQAEIQQVVDEEQARLTRVAAYINQIEQEGQMPTQEVILKTIEPQHVIAIRGTAATPSSVGAMLGEAFMNVMSNGLQVAGPPIAIFHDMEFKPTDLDVEIALPVDATLKRTIALNGGRQLATQDLPKIPLAATIVYAGSYDGIHDMYTALGRWIEVNGYRPTGPSREIYLSAPDSAEGPVTEIQFPVEKV